MTVDSTGGKNFTQLKGGAGVFGSAWYLNDGIANIILLAKVKKDSRVTFDSNTGNAFVVTN